jgi:hypothetical protein
VVLSWREKSTRYRWGLWLAVMISTPMLLFGAYFGSYMLAIHEDNRCLRRGNAAERRTRGAVEASLFFYTKSHCKQEQRPMAGHYGGYRCVSYNILGWDPIHVIYSEDDIVVRTISAYE